MAERRASAWADDQRRFHEAYDRDPTAAPRRRVEVTWRTVPPDGRIPRGIGLAVVLFQLVRGLLRLADDRHEGLEVIVRDLCPDGPGAAMRFPTDDPPGALRRGATTGVLVGEWGQNATCCLELDDGPVVWPTYNPVADRSRP